MLYSEKLSVSAPEGIGVCVGLDPTVDKLPSKFRGMSEPLFEFNREIIAATADYAAAYKPNLAFYERFGAAGWIQLEKTVRAVPEGKLVILDAKRGDIGSTAEAYADAMFNSLKGDSVTVNPYLGSDALSPFLSSKDHGVFVLAVTSNPGGADLQALQIDGKPLYIHVIELCRRLNANKNVGLVAGATKPEHWPALLEAAEDLPLLIPGVGAQGGDPKVLRALLKNYKAPAFVNSSRAIIFASTGDDFADAARKAARDLKNELTG